MDEIGLVDKILHQLGMDATSCTTLFVIHEFFGRSNGLPGGVNQEYVLLDLLNRRKYNNENEGFDGLSLVIGV